MNAEMSHQVPQHLGDEATETLGGAVTVAARLPGDLGHGLLNTANEAFVTGMQINALVGAVIAAALAILAAKLLGNVKGSLH